MKIYTSSRLLDKNHIFPDSIYIDDSGVTIKRPGLLSSKEETIPFSKISSVNIDCPMIGFSSIIISTTTQDREIKSNGFLKKEVKEMREIILNQI
mgnify:CR=1 FL=1|jgi:hypothetical protein